MSIQKNKVNNETNTNKSIEKDNKNNENNRNINDKQNLKFYYYASIEEESSN